MDSQASSCTATKTTTRSALQARQSRRRFLQGEDSLQIRNTLTSSYIESNSGNDTIDVTARIENTFLHAGQEMIASLTGTVTSSTLVAGSGADSLTFNNVVGNSSIKGFGSAEDTSDDTVVLTSAANDINVDFAKGDDSSLAKGATNATVAAAAGNDTVVRL